MMQGMTILAKVTSALLIRTSLSSVTGSSCLLNRKWYVTPETVLIPGDVLDQEVKEEDGEGEGQPEDQPHVDELDVGGRGQLVRHRHVEGVHHCREQK